MTHHARALFQENAEVRKMLDDFKCDDQVKCVRLKRHGCAGASYELKTWVRIVLEAVVDCVGRNIEACYTFGALRQLGGAVSSPAARIQHLFSLCVKAREAVASHVLAPEFVI